MDGKGAWSLEMLEDFERKMRALKSEIKDIFSEQKKRLLARLVLVSEQVLPMSLPLLSTVALYLAASWFGLFRLAVARVAIEGCWWC